MCIFTGDESALASVSGTSIFAGARTDGTQVLAYRMTVATREPIAMVLPLPVPPRSPEDAVRFIDLSGYPEFFVHMARAFPSQVVSSGAIGGAVPMPARSRTLAVHDVGSFVASFVPTRADFSRLDPRFRLSDAVWDALPDYADWGFAVFQLRDLPPRLGWFARLLGRRPEPFAHTTQTLHPMAMCFPRRDPDALFFPTVHVHDGAVHAEASFDHTLYAQLREGQAPQEQGWRPSLGPLSSAVSVRRAAGLVDAELGGFQRGLDGVLPNRDTWVRA